MRIKNKNGNISPKELFPIRYFCKEKEVQNINGIYILNSIQDMNQPIFRYMELGHLLSMLNKEVLYIPNRCSFSDLREHGYKENFSYNFNYQIVAKNKDDRKRNEYECMIRKNIYKTCVSCWTYDKHICNDGETVNEDYLMWKSYANQGIGCRIETSILELTKSVKNLDRDYDLLLGNVMYASESYDSLLNCLFKKNIYYQGEQELRLCALSIEDHVELAINPFQLIKKITMSPFINKDYANFLKEQLLISYPDLKEKVELSHIMEY